MHISFSLTGISKLFEIDSGGNLHISAILMEGSTRSVRALYALGQQLLNNGSAMVG